MESINLFNKSISRRNILSVIAILLLILLALFLVGITEKDMPPVVEVTDQQSLIAAAPVAQMIFIRGHVYDQQDIVYLEGVYVKLYYADKEELIEEKETTERGFFVFKVPLGHSYKLISTKQGYLSDTTQVEVANDFKNPHIEIDIDLNRSSQS